MSVDLASKTQVSSGSESKATHLSCASTTACSDSQSSRTAKEKQYESEITDSNDIDTVAMNEEETEEIRIDLRFNINQMCFSDLNSGKGKTQRFTALTPLSLLESDKAMVYLGHDNSSDGSNSREVALKVVNLHSVDYAHKQIETEYSIMSKLRECPHVVDVYEHLTNVSDIDFTSDEPPFAKSETLTMELCPHGDLFDFIVEHGPFEDERFLKLMMFQIC